MKFDTGSFNPFSITVHVENEEDLKELYHRFNVNIGFLRNLPSYCEADSTFPDSESETTQAIFEYLESKMP